MHPVRSFLATTGITEREFAKMVGKHGRVTTPGYVSQVICGHRYPSRALAAAMSAATGGVVTAAEILLFEANEKNA